MEIVCVALSTAHQANETGIAFFKAFFKVYLRHGCNIRNRQPQDAVRAENSSPFCEDSFHLVPPEMFEDVGGIDQIDGIPRYEIQAINRSSMIDVSIVGNIDMKNPRNEYFSATEMKLFFAIEIASGDY